MADYETGTLLTCHNCGCRLRIEIERQCAEASIPYRCTCGDEMVAIE
nr:metallothionein [Mycobacterium intracellulare]